MSWWFWALVVVVLVIGYLSQVAGRLDRLHIRVDKARSGLDKQLLLRSAVVADIAGSGLLDPATSLVLAEAAHEARSAAPWQREEAQGELTEVLQAVFADPEDVAELRADPAGAQLLDDLAEVTRKVQLSRQFLDDAVRGCARVRSQRLVRWLRLAGRAPWPSSATFVDEPPAALGAA